jgi:hypothetical protein
VVDLPGRSSAAIRCGDVPDPIGKIRRVALTRDALQGQWSVLVGVLRHPAWKQL